MWDWILTLRGKISTPKWLTLQLKKIGIHYLFKGTHIYVYFLKVHIFAIASDLALCYSQKTGRIQADQNTNNYHHYSVIIIITLEYYNSCYTSGNIDPLKNNWSEKKKLLVMQSVKNARFLAEINERCGNFTCLQR